MPSLKTYRMQDLSYFQSIQQSGPCRNCTDPRELLQTKAHTNSSPDVAAALGTVLMLEQTNKVSSTGYVTNDLASAFVSIFPFYIHIGPMTIFNYNTSQSQVNSPAFCHDVV